jgi:hypothetical protein
MTVSVNGTTGITFNDASTQNTAATGFGFKNRIINGAMMIDQRNAGASVTITNTSANTYTLDRWFAYGSAASKFSVQQNAGSVIPPTGFTNYLGVTSLAATSLGSTDQYVIGQAIEGFNVADLGWGTANASTVTLSFWVRSSLTGTFGGVVTNDGYNRNYPFAYTISSANTWEQKTITIAGDTTGTWLKTNSTGIRIIYGLGIGSSLSGTAGAWTSSSFTSVTGAVSLVGTNGATFYITGVQLEKGSTATSFDYRPYGTELALCQRYYEKSYLDAVAVPSNTEIGAFAMRQTGVNAVATIIFTESKRADPTMVYYSTQDSATSNAYDTNAGVNVSMSSLLGGQRSNSFVISGTAGNYLRFQWSSSAEL